MDPSSLRKISETCFCLERSARSFLRPDGLLIAFYRKAPGTTTARGDVPSLPIRAAARVLQERSMTRTNVKALMPTPSRDRRARSCRVTSGGFAGLIDHLKDMVDDGTVV